MWRCVLNVLVTNYRLLPPAPRASRALQGPGRRCTSAASRQLRVVVQELEQVDDKVVTPRPDPRHCGHEQKQKRKFGQNGRLTKEKKKRGDFLLQEYFRRGMYFLLQFQINSKKSPPGEITGVTVLT